jgi:biofilm PGA synthesis N-glycosyltransferase PgaC
MGSSQKGILTGRVRWGFGQYFMGTAPTYLLASAAFRFFQYPHIIGSVGMTYGFFKSAAVRSPRYEEPGFREFLRLYQRESLVYGKREATRRANDRQRHVWERKLNDDRQR